MFGFQQKITRHTKRQTTQFEGTEQTSKQDFDMARLLELSDWEFKITMVNMLKALMEKVDDMQE